MFLLLLEAGMIGVFCALDFFLFYVFWEVMLVPMYFLIGIWGGPRKLYAAIKFFLYTLVGSVVMLLAIIALYFFNTTGLLLWKGLGNAPTFDILHYHAIATPDPGRPPDLALLGLLPRLRDQGADVPVPHLAPRRPRRGADRRLRDPRRRPPEDGDVRLPPLLAADLSRRASQAGWVQAAVVGLALVGIVYGALVAMVQKDMKKLVAYSSVAHLGFVMLGFFALNHAGLQGGMLQTINHGLSTGGLFLLVGIVYERRHTRMIADFGGLSGVMPVYATLFMIILLASIGLPTLNGFIGEFTILQGAFLANWRWAAVGALGIVLGAAYMLWLYQRVFFGEMKHEENKALEDVNVREILTLVPLIVVCFWIGLYPKPFFEMTAKSTGKIVAPYRWPPSGAGREGRRGPRSLAGRPSPPAAAGRAAGRRAGSGTAGGEIGRGRSAVSAHGPLGDPSGAVPDAGVAGPSRLRRRPRRGRRRGSSRASRSGRSPSRSSSSSSPRSSRARCRGRRAPACSCWTASASSSSS